MEKILVVQCSENEGSRKEFVKNVFTDIVQNQHTLQDGNSKQIQPNQEVNTPTPFQSSKYNYFFNNRQDMETNLGYIQLNMSTCILRRTSTGTLEVFTNRKIGTSSEKRLMGKLNVLIGGHCNETDIHTTNSTVYEALLNNRQRELDEEVTITREGQSLTLSDLEPYNRTQYYIIYNEEDEVSRYHAGLYTFFLLPENAHISIKESDKLEGKFYPLDVLLEDEALDNWSKDILNTLKKSEGGYVNDRS